MVPNKERANSPHKRKRVSISPNSSPANTPESCCNDRMSTFLCEIQSTAIPLT